ncbi:MarR family winged helix-turn-helix transcriptional regulator [Kineothrix sedimenti]|uniref:MarR family transcriptional regulator n=1 Tax=Kineothrix sedimenti TaxID=3123317 RepID=A0ABZ3EUK0_9FIRM
MTNDQPLAFRIKSLNNQIRRYFERTAILENDANLTGMQYGILGFLAEQSSKTDVYQKDIEAEFNIRRSTASGMLKLLEKEGFIIRENDSGDTRLKKIIMSDRAKELNKVAKANMEKLQVLLTRGISDKEMEQFYATLKKISDNAM